MVNAWFYQCSCSQSDPLGVSSCADIKTLLEICS